MKNAFWNFRCLLALLAASLATGCQTSSPVVADAAGPDLGLREDMRLPDARPDQGADAGMERADLLAPGPETSPEVSDAKTSGDAKAPDLLPSADRVAADTGLADASTDGPTAERGSADASTDGPAAERGSADAAADRPADSATDSQADGGEAGCTGWTSLVHLQPKQLSDLLATSDPIVINVHTPYAGDIPGTDTSIPYNKVDDIEAYLHYDHCADVVLVCESGTMSQLAGDDLIKRGYLRVRDLAGGMSAWVAAGYPLLKDGGT